jgi:two-component system nitrogen regulation response regulator GlnG
MSVYSIVAAVNSVLDKFLLVQKNLQDVSGLYAVVVNKAEYAVINKVLKLTDRNKKQTAKILGISRNTLMTKMKSLGIEG